jgi:hypothetical protein
MQNDAEVSSKRADSLLYGTLFINVQGEAKVLCLFVLPTSSFDEIWIECGCLVQAYPHE